MGGGKEVGRRKLSNILNEWMMTKKNMKTFVYTHPLFLSYDAGDDDDDRWLILQRNYIMALIGMNSGSLAL